ncbi:MAG: acylphosphatase, partial [Dehalococcoidia bacterium]
FRWFIAERARRLSVTGWIANGDDGRTVELLAEGNDNALRKLETAMRQGPPSAVIESAEVEYSDALDEHDRFRIVR